MKKTLNTFFSCSPVKIRFLICLTLFTYSANAQTFTLYSDKTFGGNSREQHVSMAQVNESNFILLGSSATNINGDKTEPLCNAGPDIWIVKMDTAMNMIWDRDLGADEGSDTPDFIITRNKQIFFTCRTKSDTACDKTEHNRDSTLLSFDYWVCMLDSNGNKLWDKTLGGKELDDYSTIIELSTGEFIVCGRSYSFIGGDKTVSNYGLIDYWAIKLDSAGNKIWDKVYGGTGQEAFTTGTNNIGFTLLALEDGGFILGGTTNSPLSGTISQAGQGSNDVWFIKCDSAGNAVWDKRYGGAGNDYFECIISTPDKGYIIAASTQSQQGGDVSEVSRGGWDLWILKLDSLGNKQWDKRYGGTSNEVVNTIVSAHGGGYWISNTSNSPVSGEVSEPKYGIGNKGDYWMLKIDSVGTKLFDKRFGCPGGAGASNFVLMPDSSIYLFGSADSGISAVKTDAGKGDWDYWLVHFKYVDPVFVGVQELTMDNGQLLITPNPAKDNVELRITNAEFKNATLTLYDITGRVILQQPFNGKAELNISQLSKGMYIAEVKDKQGMSVKGKVVKE